MYHTIESFLRYDVFWEPPKTHSHLVKFFNYLNLTILTTVLNLNFHKSGESMSLKIVMGGGGGG